MAPHGQSAWERIPNIPKTLKYLYYTVLWVFSGHELLLTRDNDGNVAYLFGAFITVAACATCFFTVGSLAAYFAFVGAVAFVVLEPQMALAGDKMPFFVGMVLLLALNALSIKLRAAFLQTPVGERAEEIIAEEEERNHQILDDVPDIVLVRGPNGELEWVNKAAREFFGMTMEEMKEALAGRRRVRSETTVLHAAHDDSEVWKTGKSVDVESEPMSRTDGSVRQFHTIISPVTDKKGKVVATVTVARDITDLRVETQVETKPPMRLVA